MKQFVSWVHTILGLLEALPFPVIAAINGACLGGGLELALACHYRIAADDQSVRLGFPETKLGIIPGFGGTQRLPRLSGIERAIRAITTGEEYNAQEAKRLGIVDDEVVPRGQLLDVAYKLLDHEFRAREERLRMQTRMGWSGWRG